MRWRPLIWVLGGLAGLASCFWGIHVRQQLPSVVSAQGVGTAHPKPINYDRKYHGDAPSKAAWPHRLANTSQTAGQLAANDRAILLRNALLDTTRPLNLTIPESLRAGAHPGSYIVQSRRPADSRFRGFMEQSGAAVVSYIPNNAFLIRASAEVADRISAATETAAVLPYHPYFKLTGSLLDFVADAEGAVPPPPLTLTVLLFADTRDQTLSALDALHARILSEESSPFGPALKLSLPGEQLTTLAALPGVQEIEPAHARVPANDLTRVALGVAPDLTTATNYLGLTGSNVLVCVNDTGFDTNQPDLQGKISFDAPSTGTDTNGHGTFIAGIIAGSGSQSSAISNVPGSGAIPADFQFRGHAPGSSLFAVSLASGHDFASDSYMQQTAAHTKAFISNNSWNYAGDSQYDLAAASFDAAVRDALPAVSGAQPLLFVFSAGNAGHGSADGTGGRPDSILSPATAKNVLTIGAVEHPRFITNETWTCANSVCVTNTPWLPLTDSSNQVASFSSRGNVGIGVEGDLGRFKPDVVAPGTFILSTRSAQFDGRANFSPTNDWFTGAVDENYSEVYSNLNAGVGPYYRFDSGTSLAAASVSGTLALMQEFFEQRLGRTNSPALMKALLINGAHALPNIYSLQLQVTNFQGWGMVNLPGSLPVTLTNLASPTNGVFIFDQDAASALATGQSRTRFVSLGSAAQAQPLRVTLVWTDPPGNPISSVKLVNNLDLVVTNLDTGEVFFGNDITGNFNLPWVPNAAPHLDLVNNVENIFLAPTLGKNYSVTVLGHQVNVNAVTDQSAEVLQDYALVITSGDGQSLEALALSDNPINSSAAPLVSVITNSFLADTNDTGAVLFHQRLGTGAPALQTNSIPLPLFANASLTIGVSNQWHFYVVTNDAAFTNAAFFTFGAQTLAAGQASVVSPLAPFPSNATRIEADIDLYVSIDPALTNLNPGAIAGADKSLGRGGSELIAYSNAIAGLYYVGVKSESQEGADYGFGAVFSDSPFFSADQQNNQLLRGFPAPTPIPGGTPSVPGAISSFALTPNPIGVRRVILTNTISAPRLGDVQVALLHDSSSVVLSQFSSNGPAMSESFVYDDSGEGDLPGAQVPDGPGSLRQFAGQAGLGLWRLSLLDTNQPATNDNFSVFLEAQPDLTSGANLIVQAGACRQDYVYLPMQVTNLTVTPWLLFGSGPVTVQVCPSGSSAQACPSLFLTSTLSKDVLTVDANSHPPINPGLYIVRTCNLGTDPAAINLIASLMAAPNAPPVDRFLSSGSTPILDDAVTTSSILVTNSAPILSAAVGLRIDHPRISDLTLTLVSPVGSRVLLDENRGGVSSEGMGFDTVVTNMIPVSFSGGPAAVTNTFDVGQSPGTILLDWDFYSLPDDMRVYYETNLLFDSGLVSDTGSTNLSFGPGASTVITVVMNEGGNTNANTAWFYKLTSTRLEPVFFTFTENTNLANTPVKFAATPFTNLSLTTSAAPANGIFYLPEESLDRLIGQSAAGQWTLEVADTRAGATNPVPELLSWQLMLRFRSTVPPPIQLPPNAPWTNLLGPGQIQWFSIPTAMWISFATNTLLSASAPVNVFFNQSAPPTGTNAGDLLLLPATTVGAGVLRTNGIPPLLPGATYYIGIQNTNTDTVEVAFAVDFDVTNVITLSPGVPFPNVNPGPLGAGDFYRYTVSTNAVRAQFEIDAPAADLTLVARKGLPLPTLLSHDFMSANPGANEELIVMFDYSTPVALSPGDWYLGVVNANGTATPYTITASEYASYGTNIVISNPVGTPASFCFNWSSLPGVHYFVQGKADLSDAKWTTLSGTIVASDVLCGYCINLPSTYHFFRVSEGLVLRFPPPVIASIVASNNAVFLQWSAVTNNQFQVQWSPSLAPPAWLNFTNIISATNGACGFLDDGSQTAGLGPTRFYRLRHLPQ